MKRLLILLNSVVCVLLLLGCGASPEQQLEQAKKAATPQAKILLLQSAYDQFQSGGDSEAAARIPQQVYSLSVQTGDMPAFDWALANGAKANLQYQELLRFWALGPEWRERIMADYPDEALPTFMGQAIQTYRRRFVFQHLERFKANGFKPHRFMVAGQFHARFCRFLADQMEYAVEKADLEQLEFLIDNMPLVDPDLSVDARTEEILRLVGDYVFQTLENEDLACKLVGLGYEQNPFNPSSPAFGEKLSAALRARPEYAIRMFGYDGWKGALTPADVEFLNTLSDASLLSLSLQYVDEATALCMDAGDDAGTLRYIQIHAQKEPFDRASYVELMNRSARHGSMFGVDYVLENCDDIDLFSLDLAALAETQVLFVEYAPQLMGKIYPTMDLRPKKDGVSLGKINEVFAAKNEEAGLFVVQQYDLSKVWSKVTNGRTLLMDVCLAGNLAAARYLVEERGENVRAITGYRQLEVSIFGRVRPKEGKLGPIFFAAQSGNSELIRYLVQTKHVEVNSRSNFGATPLMYAVSERHLDAVNTLIELNAKVNLSMDENLNNGIDMHDLGAYDDLSNAYRRARSSGQIEVLEVLEKAGARP